MAWNFIQLRVVFAKTITWVVAFIVVISFMVAIHGRQAPMRTEKGN